ncbi:hypothetical protein JCM19238_3803 [Vibrio ponticus]|nr:hypothetical protein JCM19238_3803 [Vibrio ponticus]
MDAALNGCLSMVAILCHSLGEAMYIKWIYLRKESGGQDDEM